VLHRDYGKLRAKLRGAYWDPTASERGM